MMNFKTLGGIGGFGRRFSGLARSLNFMKLSHFSFGIDKMPKVCYNETMKQRKEEKRNVERP